MNGVTIRILVSIFAISVSYSALAHTPLFDCFDNGDDSVSCEGGFSDGASAAGLHVRILDDREKLLLEKTMEDDSTVTFPMPEADSYTVVFDAGDGHSVTLYSDDIY